MTHDWTPDERRLLRSLNTPDKIQHHLDQLTYNPTDHASSPRWVMITNEGHCFEGGMLAAAALEFHGRAPLMIDLIAERDDHHVLAVYRTETGWGSISKSNTGLLRGRRPFYRSPRELVMSYFDFYFNTKGEYSLYGYSNPFSLNAYNSWNWRTSDDDLMEMGMSFCERVHFEILDQKTLRRLTPATKAVQAACFLGADPNGLFQA